MLHVESALIVKVEVVPEGNATPLYVKAFHVPIIGSTVTVHVLFVNRVPVTVSPFESLKVKLLPLT